MGRDTPRSKLPPPFPLTPLANSCNYPVAKKILLNYVHCAPSPSHAVFSNPFPTPPMSLPLPKDHLRVANQLCLCLHKSIVKASGHLRCFSGMLKSVSRLDCC